MSQVKYQITLALDGNHQVLVTSDDALDAKEGLDWAKSIYQQLKERAEIKQATPLPVSTTYHHDIAPPEQTPSCAIHKQPMAEMKGPKGTFWSCHQKLDDGSWCPYRPPK